MHFITVVIINKSAEKTISLPIFVYSASQISPLSQFVPALIRRSVIRRVILIFSSVKFNVGNKPAVIRAVDYLVLIESLIFEDRGILCCGDMVAGAP